MLEPLNYLDPGFPMQAETRVFRTLETILRNDSILGARVRTWVTFKGEDLDRAEMPSADLCPYLLIGPWPVLSEWATEAQHRVQLLSRFLLVVAGSNVDHLTNFAGAVRAAIFPQNDPARRDAIVDRILAAANNTARPVMRFGAFGPRFDPNGDPLMVGEGSIEINILVGT